MTRGSQALNGFITPLHCPSVQSDPVAHPSTSPYALRPTLLTHSTTASAMAINMDDLIGSMQHGFHAGDRGNDLNEIRESLKMSLGQQQSNTPAVGPSIPQYAFASRRNPFQPPPGASSLDADIAMLSSASSSSQPYHHQPSLYPQSSFFGSPGVAAGPASWGSQSSTSSSTALGGGYGFAPAPANTPQQTPVETSALARQLQAELERQQTQQQQQFGAAGIANQSHYAIHSTAVPGNQAPISPTLSNGITGGGVHSSPTSSTEAHAETRAPASGLADQPRSYVNGFVTRDDSATPVGPDSISPNQQHNQHHGLASP